MTTKKNRRRYIAIYAIYGDYEAPDKKELQGLEDSLDRQVKKESQGKADPQDKQVQELQGKGDSLTMKLPIRMDFQYDIVGESMSGLEMFIQASVIVDSNGTS